MKRFKIFVMEKFLGHSNNQNNYTGEDIYVNPIPSEVNKIFKGHPKGDLYKFSYARGLVSKAGNLYTCTGLKTTHNQIRNIVFDLYQDGKITDEDPVWQPENGVEVVILHNYQMWLSDNFGSGIPSSEHMKKYSKRMNICKSKNKWLAGINYAPVMVYIASELENKK